MTKEAVQIVEIQQPICGNVFGTSPCAATGEKCYNTRATCQDEPNFRYNPEWLLTATLTKAQGDTVTSSEVDIFKPIFAAFDVIIPDSPDGVIWEQGGTGRGCFLGFTSGNLIWRAGDGSVSSSNNMGKVSVSGTPYEGMDATFIVSASATTDIASIWVWDNVERTLTLVGTDTASAGFSSNQWAGSSDGGVGFAAGTMVVGESTANFNGTISRATFYDDTAPPDMSDDWRTRLFFSRGNLPDRAIEGAPFIRPLLKSVSTSPTRVNVASSNPDASGMGNRALVNIAFSDAADTDKIVDPYLSGRTWNPLARGSFWTKWIVRNKYRQNFPIKVYDGTAGQSLGEMVKREYFMSAMRGPDGGGVTISGKDILAFAEERKAQAPLLSVGKLYADINDSVTSFEVIASEADYPSSGTIRIDKEVMTYSSRASSTNGITFTISSRETDGTVADEHDAAALVQECLRFTSESPDDIAKILLNEYALIPTKYMNLTLWSSEVGNYLSGFPLTSLITEPTSVALLVSEMQRDVGFFMWWDDRSSLIDMKAIRGVDALPDLLSAENHIIDGSFSITEKPRERLSQVWLYFSPRDAAENLKEAKNYRFAQIQADLAAEGEDEYGDSQIKTIKSRWLTTTAQALSTTSKTVVRYRDTPRECVFSVDVKDRQYWTGSTIRISHYLDVDMHGDRNISNWFVMSAEEIGAGNSVRLTCQDVALYGKITLIVANGTPDYIGDGSEAYTAGYIGDANGLLSDGTDSARTA